MLGQMVADLSQYLCESLILNWTKTQLLSLLDTFETHVCIMFYSLEDYGNSY